MNLAEIRSQFDRLCRTVGLTDYDTYREDWLNNGWAALAEEFTFPSLKMSQTSPTIEDQDTYDFPYVYDGTDISLYVDGKRIHYQPEESLDLAYSRRTGNKGQVKHYDWAGIRAKNSTATVPGTPHGVILENRSPIVRVSGGFLFVSSHVGDWLRFDPWDDADSVERNPGEFGYKVVEVNTDAIGNYARLEEAYRGPSSTDANPTSLSVQPKETQIFRLYGSPNVDNDVIEVKCWRRPRRLYNDEDVPEYPRIGLAVAYMGIAQGLRHLKKYDEAEAWRADAYALLGGVKRRRRQVQTTSPDLPHTNVGNKTNIRARRNPRYGGLR